jgi:anti-anti-sigma regulatory factor
MSENTIKIGSDFHVRDHRVFASKLKELIEFRGFERVHLDFSQTETCFQDAALPLTALVRKYRHEGVQFKIELPRFDRLRRLFINCNWARLMSPTEFPPPDERSDLNLPATEYRDDGEQHQLVRGIIDRVLKVTQHLERSHLRAFEWSLNEITDNVLLHSESATGGIAQLSIRPRSRELEFIVADAGVGIPESLRIGKKETWDDLEALKQSIKEGVTRGVGQGNGLFGTARVCQLSGGAFSINSGSAYLAGTREQLVTGQMHELSFGCTSVACAMSYARPLVLEEALKFAGRSSAKVDFMELDYEGFEGNAAIVRVEKESISVGSRRSGAELRRKLENISRMSDSSTVIIDFSGLPVWSSSFADEALAKLIQTMGIVEFRSRFRLVNLDGVNRQILERSTRQRLSLPENETIEL